MKINIFPKMLSFVIPFLEVIKMVIASVASVALLGFAGLTLAGSTVGLVVSTPLFIIFSPILVPATVATTLLATGLTAGGSLGGTALGLIIWLIKHRMGVKPKDNPPTTEGGSSAPLAKTFLPFFGRLIDQPVGGGAAPPASEAAPTSGAAPAGGSNPANGIKWSWSWGRKPFFENIPGWFGGIPGGGGAPTGGSSPTGGLKWNWSWGGKSYSGTIPFGDTSAGGSTPASGGTPAGGNPTTE